MDNETIIDIKNNINNNEINNFTRKITQLQ